MAKAESFSPAHALIACAVAALIAALAVLPADAEASARFDRVERAIVKKLNRIRAANGLPALLRNGALARSADAHCADMLRADFFAHSSSNGQSFADRVESYRPSKTVGETLAWVSKRQSRRQASRIVKMWMASPPHRASLMDGKFRRIGVARRVGSLGSTRAIVFTADLATKH